MKDRVCRDKIPIPVRNLTSERERGVCGEIVILGTTNMKPKFKTQEKKCKEFSPDLGESWPLAEHPGYEDHPSSCPATWSNNRFCRWKQGFVSGSAYIRIRFPSWIWIPIQYTETDPGGKILKKNLKKLSVFYFKKIRKFQPAPLLSFEQSFFKYLFQLKKTLYMVGTMC